MRKKHYFNFFSPSNITLTNNSIPMNVEEDTIKKIIDLCDKYLTKYPEPEILPAPPMQFIKDADNDNENWLYHENTHPSTIVSDIKAIAENNWMGWTYGKRLELVSEKLHDESVQHIMNKSAPFEKFVNTVKNVLKALFTFNFKDIFKSQDKTDTCHKIDELISI